MFSIQLFHIVGVVFIILSNQNDFLIMRHIWHWGNTTSTSPTKGVSHYGLAIYILKYLKAKEEELQKLKYSTIQKI